MLHVPFHSPSEEFRPGSEEMTRLMNESMIGGAPPNLGITTTTEQHGEDGGEFEVIIPKANLVDSLPEVSLTFYPHLQPM